MTDERAAEAAAEAVQGNEGSECTEGIAPEPVPASPGEAEGPLDALRAGMAELNRIRDGLDQQIDPPGIFEVEAAAISERGAR